MILKEEFIEAFGLSAYKVSQETGISQTALGEILRGKRSISPANSLKLAKFFGMSEDFFANLQTQYELDKAKSREGKKIAQIIPFPKKAKATDEELLEA